MKRQAPHYANSGASSGQEALHVEELWDQPVNRDFTFFQPAEMAGSLEAAGFEVAEVIKRDPYPEVEYPSRRAYIFARNPQNL